MSPALTISGKIIEIIAEELDITLDIIKANAKFDDDLGASNIDMIEIILSAGSEFNMPIPDDEAAAMQTVGQLVSWMEKRVHARDKDS